MLLEKHVAAGDPVDATAAPGRRRADWVTPFDRQGQPDECGSFRRPGSSTIYREQRQRLIALKFEVRDRAGGMEH